jgi:peptidoglycan/LPS O-acetylase OafA/YrhL
VQAVFRHRKEVDGLRSIAVLVVILYHANFSFFSGGYVGVDVFFVISGYLISSIIYKEVLNNDFKFLSFYERRIRRIFPMIFTLLFVTIPVAFIFYSPQELRNFFQSVLSTVTYSSNIYFWKKTGYFSQALDSLPLIHTWSLAVEEQYYIVFPIIFVLAAKIGKWFISILFALIAILSLFLCFRIFLGSEINFFFMPMRAWELLAGAGLSLQQKAYYSNSIKGGWIYNALSVIGLAFILYATIYFDDNILYPGPLTLIPIIGTVFLIFSLSSETLIGKILSNNLIVHLGLLSYSAYLIHQPLFVFYRYISHTEVSILEYIFLILLTFVLSHFTWKYIETPFRHKKNFSSKKIFVLAFVFSLTISSVAFLGHHFKGFPQRFSSGQQAIMSSIEVSPFRNSCHTEGVNFLSPSYACKFFSDSVTWAIFGDSHGVELSYALAKKIKNTNQGVIQLTSSGCQPAFIFESNTPGCSKWIRESMNYLQKNTNITNVILVFRHSFYLFGDQLQVYPGIPNKSPVFISGLSADSAREIYWKSFLRMIELLLKSGKKVYLIDPIPEIGNLLSKSIFNNNIFQSTAIDTLGSTMNYYNQRHQYILSKVDTIECSDRNLFRIRPVEFLKVGDRLKVISQKKSFYFDDNHLSLHGADQLAQLLLSNVSVK